MPVRVRPSASSEDRRFKRETDGSCGAVATQRRALKRTKAPSPGQLFANSVSRRSICVLVFTKSALPRSHAANCKPLSRLASTWNFQNMACRLLRDSRMEESQQMSPNCAALARSAGQSSQRNDEKVPARSDHLLTAPTQEPNAARLASDERFWREAISTWQSLLQSKPQHPETLRYLKSCQAKLVEVLVLLGKSDEAAEQNQAVAATARQLEEVRSKARAPSHRVVAVLVCIALMAAAAILLLMHGTSPSSARQQEPLQQSEALETEHTALVPDG